MTEQELGVNPSVGGHTDRGGPMDFDAAIARRGLFSAEMRVNRATTVSIALWLLVAGDLSDWLIRSN